MRKAGILAATMLGATLVAAGPVLADPPGGCPPGLAKQGRCAQFPGWDGRDRQDRRDRHDRAREQRAYDEGYRDAMRDAWRVGQRLPRDRYRVVPDYHQYGWPDPRDGRTYVYADDRYFLIEQATGMILDILTR